MYNIVQFSPNFYSHVMIWESESSLRKGNFGKLQENRAKTGKCEESNK